MEEIGVVKWAEGPRAIVTVKRQTACDACASGSSCKTTQSGMEIEAFNAVRAEAGRPEDALTGRPEVRPTRLAVGPTHACSVTL